MRCHYLSDLHLEAGEFPFDLPRGDVLVIAGDLCHASRLSPDRTDRYSLEQRDRVLRFAEQACTRFANVLLVAGNHDHYDGIYEETIASLRRGLPGFTVLDDEAVEIGGIRFFGATFWTDFDGGDPRLMDAVRKRMGEYFFVRTRNADAAATPGLRKFQPEDAARACASAKHALAAAMAAAPRAPLVVITHHAPSRRGLNPLHRGNGADPAYASDCEALIEAHPGIRFWVHGHTHIRRTYGIGTTRVVSNARGFPGKDPSAAGFSAAAHFDL